MKRQELQQNLIDCGMFEGRVYTKEDLVRMYGKGVFQGKNTSELEAYGAYRMFSKFLHQAFGQSYKDIKRCVTVLPWDCVAFCSPSFELDEGLCIMGYYYYEDMLLAIVKDMKDAEMVYCQIEIDW